MAENTKHQHYVPRCYIKNFINLENGRVAKYCFMQNRYLDDRIENVCHKRNLYEWDKENSANEIENRFSKYESGYSIRLTDFISKISRIKVQDMKLYKVIDGFTSLGLDLLLNDIIIQMFRLPRVVNRMSDIMLEAYKSVDAKCLKNPIVVNASEKVKTLALKGVGLNTIFPDIEKDSSNINSEFIKCIYDIIWSTHNIVIYKSERLHFFSSCNPIVINYQGEIDRKSKDFNTEYLFKNSDLYFSISPHICIGVEYSDSIENSGNVYVAKVNNSLYKSILTALIRQSDYCIYSDKITEKDISFVENVLEEKRKMHK